VTYVGRKFASTIVRSFVIIVDLRETVVMPRLIDTLMGICYRCKSETMVPVYCVALNKFHCVRCVEIPLCYENEHMVERIFRKWLGGERGGPTANIAC